MLGDRAIDNIIRTSKLDNEYTLRWFSSGEFTNIESSQNIAGQTIHYAQTVDTEVMLLLLGNIEECTPAFMSEFARTYSLPRQKDDIPPRQFRIYSRWLDTRNKLIYGFTKRDDKYYMVAKRRFYCSYSRYGFCSACGMLRCSPVWCVCGHKELSDGWTSNSMKLDEFIKRSQIQTNSADEAYLEWIPFDCIKRNVQLYGLPTRACIKLIPLEITDETHDLYYAEVNHLLCVSCLFTSLNNY